jgi:ABC-type multidrug transport system permease subunit
MNSTKSINIIIAAIGIIASIYGYFTSENNGLFIVTFISSTSLLTVLFEEKKNKKIKNN